MLASAFHEDSPAMPKVLIVAALAAILTALFSGMFFLVKDSSRSRRTVRALTVRIGLSLALILFLFVGMKTGYIRPHNALPPSAVRNQGAATPPADGPALRP